MHVVPTRSRQLLGPIGDSNLDLNNLESKIQKYRKKGKKNGRTKIKKKIKSKNNNKIKKNTFHQTTEFPKYLLREKIWVCDIIVICLKERGNFFLNRYSFPVL